MNDGLRYFRLYRFRYRRRLLFLGLEHKELLDEILMSALYFMVFVAGIEIGGNRHIIKKSAIRRVFCWR